MRLSVMSGTFSTVWEILGSNFVTMNTFIRKFISVLAFGVLLLPGIASAQGDFPWTVLFHLKEANGVLSIDTENRFPYEPIPGRYGIDTKAVEPATAAYYGEFQDAKGENLLRFGVEIPNTIVGGKNYTAVEVWAPLRGDAVKAVFFTKDGKRLFEISTKSTLVCNSNGSCDSDYGENGYNCPLECPLSQEDIETPATSEPTPIPDSLIPDTTPIAPGNTEPSAPAPVVTPNGDATESTPMVNPLVIYGGFSVLSALVLGFIIRAFLRYKKGEEAGL